MKRNLDDSSSQHQKRKRSNNLSSKNVESLLNMLKRQMYRVSVYLISLLSMRNSATVDKRMAGVEEMREVVMRPGELVPVRIEGKDQPLSTGSEVYSGKVPKGPEDLD